MKSQYPWLLLLVPILAGPGCASKKQATQPMAMSTPTSGDNVVVSTMQGAGRSIVNGTKKGYASAKAGIQKWVDPAASETASNLDKAGKEVDIDRQASTGPKTVVKGHTSEDGPTRTAQVTDDGESSAGRKATTTRVGTRPVGTNVADSFVSE